MVLVSVISRMPVMSYTALKAELRAAGDSDKAAFFPNFFKTGKGQYGEGDIFYGVTVPAQRMIAKGHLDLPLKDIEQLLGDTVHECRLTALIILVNQFEREDEKGRKKIVDFYLSHLDRVNNWDLVDSTAPQILGTWLLDKDWKMLKAMAKKKHLWTQRVAMVATHAFIREGNMKPTKEIAELLLDHSHDLIHKAVGWMLREMGKRDEASLRKFLDTHAATMPRTALRYAIERLTPAQKKRYMQIPRSQ